MNKYYQRGRRAEWEAKKILEKKGYRVFRTAGSKGVDLIALYHAEMNLPVCQVRLIEVKTCCSKDLNRYKRKKEKGIELWIKVLQKGWVKL